MGLRLGFEQLTDSESGASLDVRRTMDLQYTMLLSASRVRCAALLTMPRPRNALSLTVGVVALIRCEIEVTLLDGRQSWGQIG